MRWFRYYSEAAHDGKVQRLPPPLFKHWMNLLCLANEGKPRGRLPSMEDIAFWLHVPKTRAEKIIEDLTARGLIEEDNGHLVPHNWDGRQPQSDNATERMQNIRRTSSEHVRSRGDKKRTEQRREEERREETEENPTIFTLYEQVVSPLTQPMSQKLEEAENEYSQECIRHSFDEADRQNKRSWAYIEAILKAHKREGCYAKSGPRNARKGAKSAPASSGPDLGPWKRFAAGKD